MNNPLLLSTDAAAQTIGCRKTKLFALLGAGEIETVLLGRRRMVVTESLTAYVDRLRAQAKRAEAA